MSRNGLEAKSRLAYVPDQPFLYDKLTGREFLGFVARMYGISAGRRDRTLGELTGCQPRAQESFFRRARSRAQEQLQRARRRAAAEKQVVEIDASRLSGTNGGDHWLVQPDGRCRRRLQPFPTAEQLLLADRQRPPACRPCPDLDRARPLLLRCAYDGLWSPSGTNWQPVRTVELPPALMSRLAGRPVRISLLMMSLACPPPRNWPCPRMAGRCGPPPRGGTAREAATRSASSR